MDSYCSGIYSFRFNFSHSVICIHLYALGPIRVAAPPLCHLTTVGGLIFAIFIIQILCIWFTFRRFLNLLRPLIGGVRGHAFTPATALNMKKSSWSVQKLQWKKKLWFSRIGIGRDVCKLFHSTPLVSIELINSWSNQSRHAQAHVPFDIRSHVCSIHSVVAPQHIWWARLCSVHHHHNIQDFFYWKREGSCRDTGHNSK